MRAFTQALLVLLAGLLMASCGGGGGGGSDSGFNPPGVNVAVIAASTTTTPNSLVGITVRVTTGNGSPINDGTTVTLQISPPGVGLVSSTAPILLADRVTSTTAGGIATFRLHSRAVGTATLTASVPDPNSPGRTLTATGSVAVQAGPPQDPRLQIQLQTATLPVNPQFITPFIGSPFLSEAVITWRTLDGALAPGCIDCVSVATNAQGGQNIVIGFTTPDDPDTTDVNEFTEVVLQSGPTDVNGGRTVVYVLALDRAGTGVLTATATDPQTQETVSAQAIITVSNGTPGLPASILIDQISGPVYIADVNGPHTAAVRTTVFDGGLTTVPNPPAGVNNVRLEIVGGAQNGERLRGTSASGATQQGTAISIPTANGLANAAYEAGTRSGFVTLRATADRADNNVDNGITDQVTSTRQFTVSDGRIFAIDIASPADVVAGGTVIPGDDTYQMIVEAVATDRFGIPPSPGSEIQWGLIDFPQTNGQFDIAGPDGNPAEGGTLFIAPTGAFTTAGGGAGPGDTLIVFGDEPTGPNRDLESARTVASINGATSLTTQYRFNFNDDTGTPVDNGPVLPYIIGRAVDANVAASSVTDAAGRTDSIVTYGRSKIGKRIALWARGQGDFVQGSPELVTDAELLRLQAAGPLTISAPSSVRANRTENIQVCVDDAEGNPVPSILVDYTVDFSGVFTVDGSSAASGTVANVTGDDGCTTVAFTSTGVTGSGTVGTITWRVDDAEAETDIVGPEGLTLVATPSSVTVTSSSAGIEIRLCLFDDAGPGIPGVNVTGTCTPPANLQIVGGINPTDAAGCTRAFVQATNLCSDADGPGPNPPTLTSGTCTFQTIGPSPATATVTFTGAAAIDPGFSPPTICN